MQSRQLISCQGCSGLLALYKKSMMKKASARISLEKNNLFNIFRVFNLLKNLNIFNLSDISITDM